MIDTHTHLFDPRFDADIDDAINRAVNMGVSDFILPATDSKSHDQLIQIYKKYPKVTHPTIGVHPTSVNDNPHWKQELEIARKHLFNSDIPFVAIGEIGLDLYWSRDFLAQQIEALHTQIEWAIDKNLPVIFHVRDAWHQIFDALAPFKGQLRGVFHSFSGSIDEYTKTQQLGDFYVGISGIVTFKNSTLPSLITNIPVQRILLETDAPYLAPTPHRGQRNESSYIPLIAAKIAEIKQISIEQVDQITTSNARQLFAI